MSEEALQERREVLRLAGRESEARELQRVYDEDGEQGMVRWYIQRGLRKASLTNKEGGGNRAWSLALFYARIGDTDEAFQWLDEATRQRGGFVILVKVHPWLDSLRSDARYDESLRTMNLAE